MNAWSLLPTLSADMPFQMALDEILFGESLETPFLRFYFSSGLWITVGCSHNESKGSDPKGQTLLCTGKNEVPVCKRITGGGTVLHGDDLLFSLAGLKEHDDSFRSVRVAYWKIHEAVKHGFEALGAKPEFYRCDENLGRGSDCFRFPVASDLRLSGHKIAGGAQRRSGRRFLHQESVRPEGFDAGPLALAIQQGFEKVFGVRLGPKDLEPETLEEARRLTLNKYDEKSKGSDPKGLTLLGKR